MPRQLIPPPATVPLPLTVTVSTLSDGSKVAAALLAMSILQVALSPENSQLPSHPVSLWPLSALASSTTVSPWGKDFEQVPRQLIPPPATVPLPLTVTVSVLGIGDLQLSSSIAEMVSAQGSVVAATVSVGHPVL